MSERNGFLFIYIVFICIYIGNNHNFLISGFSSCYHVSSPLGCKQRKLQLYSVGLRAVSFPHFPDEFDAAAIADKLKAVADKLNDDMAFRAALNDFKKAVAKEVGCIA